jgi:hypothetical protein
MAPAVHLPVLSVTELRTEISKDCWADVIDATPSPWHGDAPYFKPAWPDTPTPSTTLDMALHNFADKHICPTLPTATLAFSDAGHAGITAQLFPTNALVQPAAEQMAVVNEAIPFQGSIFPTLAQTCPVATEMSMPCIDAHSMQQGFGHTCPGVDASDLQVHQGWYMTVDMSRANEQYVQPYDMWGADAKLAPYNTDAWRNAASDMHTVEPAPGQWSNAKDEPLIQDKAQTPASPPLENVVAEPPLAESQRTLEHRSGQCKPCAWYWRPQGCRNGEKCAYCHMCPEGELKARKKNKIDAMRMGALTPVKTSQVGTSWGLKLDSLLRQ